MPKYLIERHFHVGEDQMPLVGRKSRRLTEEDFAGQIDWVHSHVAVDENGHVRTFCVYDAPSEEIVRSHAEQLGLHDVKAVYEIVGDVTPADFPLD